MGTTNDQGLGLRWYYLGIFGTEIIEIIKQNGRATFRDLMIRLPDSIGAQDVWNSLRTLPKAEIVTPIKISNRKSSWKINK
ncbi:MAG: hypothetical protein WB988_26960 [Candidatus Nitrosopolaris sp.]